MRNIKYQEELKVLFERLYRTEDLNEDQWQEKYRILKDGSPMEVFGEALERFVQGGKTLEESVDTLYIMIKNK